LILTEREVPSKQFVATVDQDGIHTNVDERSSIPDGEDIDEKIAD